MYKVGITGFFSAIHSLEGDVPEEEKTPHPHDYKLEWTLEVSELDERGFSLDISLLEKLRDSEFSKLEGKNLNKDRHFLNRPVSLENLCDFIFSNFSSELSLQISNTAFERIASMEIRIWENEQAWAGISRNIQ